VRVLLRGEIEIGEIDRYGRERDRGEIEIGERER
jgi:hypothetical protein